MPKKEKMWESRRKVSSEIHNSRLSAFKNTAVNRPKTKNHRETIQCKKSISCHKNSYYTNSHNPNFFRVDVRSQNANSRKNRHNKFVDVDVELHAHIKNIDDPTTPWFHFKGNDSIYI